MPIGIIVSILIAIVIAVVFLGFFIPTAKASGEAASCTGFLKGLASILADMTGTSIC